jgi:hypothetical protein
MAATPLRHTWSDPAAYETFMGRWSELLAPRFFSFRAFLLVTVCLISGAGRAFYQKLWPTEACT